MDIARTLKDRLYPARRVSALAFALLVIPMIVPAAYAGGVNWQQLNLSPQQSDKIERIESEWDRQRDQVSAQIERDKEELKTILPNGDRNRIQFLQMRITHNTMYLQKESMQSFLDKRDVLAPEQRAKLQKILPAAIPASAPAAGRAGNSR